MKHLHERMDDIFGNGTVWQHRTLRTLFDPASAEWDMTTMERKVAILRKMQSFGERLSRIAWEYKRFYKTDMNRPDIANDFENGLVAITEYLLENKSSVE